MVNLKTTEFKKVVAKNIRNARLAKHWTQEDLAKSLGISRQTVCNWEQCVSVPNFNTAADVAKVLDVSMDYFVS